MSLKIEDIQVGDELVCVDITSFKRLASNNAWLIMNTPLIVFSISKCGEYAFLTGDEKTSESITKNEIHLFKKKEQPKYTLDDLISISNKAKDDGLSFGLTLIYSDENGDRYTGFDATQNKIKQEIDYIKSLYKETFVIECEEDIARIKRGAVITLQNGNAVSVVIATNYTVCNAIKVDDWQCYLEFVSLKGATVEQERGRDDRS